MNEADNLADAPEPELIYDIDDQEAEPAEPETDEDGNPIEEPDEPEDDSEEVDYEGEKYRVPKALKDALLRQSDYTQKTQALSDQRRELETRLERFDAASKAENSALAKVAWTQAQLAQFEGIDWDQWDRIDPNAANRARWQLSELRQQAEGAQAEYRNAQGEARSIAQQEAARRIEEGRKVLAERIPDWSDDKARAIVDTAHKVYGFSMDDLQSIDDPRVIIALNDALEYQKGQKKAAASQKVAKQQAIKPAGKVKGATAKIFRGPETAMSDEQWFAAREKQVRNKS